MPSIREAQATDLPQMLEIYNDVILHTTAVFEYKPHTLAMRTEWHATRIKEGWPVLVAASGNDILGFGSLGPFRAWAAYKYTAENSVYVAAEHRKKGIAKLLLAALIEAAVKKDLHAVIASVEATNLASLHLHQAFGFEEVAHFREVGFKFGRWLDLKFLELMLDGPAHPESPVEG